MIHETISVAIAFSFIAFLLILVAGFRIRLWHETKSKVKEFYLVIDADAEYRIIACCTYFEDALQLCRELFEKNINADVIPVDLNTVYDYE